MVKKICSNAYLTIIFLFLYLPILVLVVLSFNNSKSRVVWGGFTGKWYLSMFQNDTIMRAFSTTLQITLTASILATIIGTLAAIGIHAMRSKGKAIMLGATNIPLLNADIVTGISKTEGSHIEITDRAEAVKYAIDNALPGDIIVIAGKGHEDYQEINGVRHHMDDRELVLEAAKCV